MSSFKRIKKTNIIHCAILLGVYLVLVLVITRFKYAYGSKLDWNSQHYAIPEYFRNLFYETGELFPSFAPNLGAGENIYNFSYYGLFSPIILISYLLPFVKMNVYIQAISIIGVIASILLFYRFMCKKFNDKTAFLLSFVFLSASPFVFHSHRHIMFVNYMPFLILAMESVDAFFEKGKKQALVIWSLMIILSSYFFSVSAIIMLVVYGVYRYLQLNEKFYIKDFLTQGFSFAGRLFTSVLMAGILLLPTVAVMLKGRDSANVKTDFKQFIPQIRLDYIGINSYGMGLSCFVVLAVIFAIIKKDKASRFAGIVFAVMMTCPLVVYILNGGLYFDPKVYIPFVPFAILLIGETYTDICSRKRGFKLAFLMSLVVLINGLVFFNGWKSTRLFMLADFAIFTVCMILFAYRHKKQYLCFAMTFMSFVSMVSFNSYDKLVLLDDIEYINSDKFKEVADIIADDTDIVRSSTTIERAQTVNKVYGDYYYTPYVYSSIHHKGYSNFYFNEISNENEFRNTALTTRSSNILFDIFMGNKYLISDKSTVESGYELVEQVDDLYLYKNDKVNPVAFSSPRILSYTDYQDLDAVKQMEALAKYIIVDDSVTNGYSTSVVPYYGIDISESKSISEVEGGYKIKSKKNFDINIDLDSPIPNDKLLVVQIMVDNKVGKKDDVSISINGIKNTLTNPTWKYYNGNRMFQYVLTAQNEETLNQLKFEFKKGNYMISDVSAYLMDYPDNWRVDEFNFDKQRTKGDVIAGSIDCNDEGYFQLTVPYDTGFEITIDGKKQDYEIVNTTFIGFPISTGHHEIVMKYTAPLRKEGVIMSICGVLVFVVLGIFEAYRNKKNKKAV